MALDDVLPQGYCVVGDVFQPNRKDALLRPRDGGRLADYIELMAPGVLDELIIQYSAQKGRRKGLRRPHLRQALDETVRRVGFRLEVNTLRYLFYDGGGLLLSPVDQMGTAKERFDAFVRSMDDLLRAYVPQYHFAARRWGDVAAQLKGTSAGNSCR